MLIKSTAQVPLNFDRDKEMKSTSRVKIEIKAIMNAQGKLFRQKTAKSEMQRIVEKDFKSKFTSIFRKMSMAHDQSNLKLDTIKSENMSSNESSRHK